MPITENAAAAQLLRKPQPSVPNSSGIGPNSPDGKFPKPACTVGTSERTKSSGRDFAGSSETARPHGDDCSRGRPSCVTQHNVCYPPFRAFKGAGRKERRKGRRRGCRQWADCSSLDRVPTANEPLQSLFESALILRPALRLLPLPPPSSPSFWSAPKERRELTQ